MKPASFVRIATLWIATTCVFVQAKPAFEVASIKRNVSNAGGSFFRWEADGTLRVWNTSLQEIVRLAYYLDAYQVVDWPRWMADERFDIAAKPEGKPSQPVRIDMLRTLLAERFKLAMHTETRDGPAYALVVAKGEHLKLRPSDATDCGEPRRRSSGWRPRAAYAHFRGILSPPTCLSGCSRGHLRRGLSVPSPMKQASLETSTSI